MAASRVLDVIVAGGGAAGLAAAKHLLEINGSAPASSPAVSLLLVEARGRLGGRIHTVSSERLHVRDSLHSGEHAVDLGASFVHGTAGGNPLTDLSKKVPFALHFPSAEAAFAIYEADARGIPLPADRAERLEFYSHLTTFARTQRLAQESDMIVPPDASLDSALRSAKAGEGVWRGVSEVERAQLLVLSRQWAGWTGAELDQVSLRYWGFGQDFPGEDAVVQPGYGSLIKWLARGVEDAGGRIQLDTVVEHVKRDPDAQLVEVVLRGADGRAETVRARHLIGSFPLGWLQAHAERLFQPQLPRRRLAALHRLGHGLLNKVILKYKAPWWQSVSTEVKDSPWISILPQGIRAGTRPEAERPTDGSSRDSLHEQLCESSLLFQDATHITGDPVLVAFVGPPLGYTIEGFDDDEIASAFHHRLVAAVAPTDDAQTAPPRPSEALVTRWASDSWSLGSYSYIPAGGATPLDMAELGHPLWDGTLGFCGEHTHPDCYASVHGAYLSGLREGERVGHRLLEARSEA